MSASSVPTQNSTNCWCLPRLLLPPPMAVWRKECQKPVLSSAKCCTHTWCSHCVLSVSAGVLRVFLVSTWWFCLHPFFISGFGTLTPTFLLWEQALPKASERQSTWQRAMRYRHTWHTQPGLATHYGCHWAGLAELRHIISQLRNTRRSLQLVSLKDFSLNDN